MLINGNKLKNKIENINYIPISNINITDRYDEKDKIKLKCRICGIEKEYTAKTIMYKPISCKCNEYREKIRKIEELYNIHIIKYEYCKNTNKSYILYKCKECNKTIRERLDKLKNSQFICNECKNINKTKEIQKILDDKFGTIYKIKTIYTGYHNYLLVKCLKCGYEYEITPANIIAGKRCINCSVKQSKACDTIEKFLNLNNIKYLKEFKFDDLVYKKHLRFDYAVLDEENKIKLLIEYNGKQHYIDENWGDDFDICQKRDKLKIDYCKDNNINLLIITYLQEKDIEEILKDNIL